MHQEPHTIPSRPKYEGTRGSMIYASVVAVTQQYYAYSS